MEYQKIINLLDNASNQPSKFRTKNRIELNNDSRGTYNTMLKSSLWDYSDVYIFDKGRIAVTGASDNAKAKQ